MKKLQMLTAFLSRYAAAPDFLECATDNGADWAIFTASEDAILVNAGDEGFQISEDEGKTWKSLETVSQLKAAIANREANPR